MEALKSLARTAFCEILLSATFHFEQGFWFHVGAFHCACAALGQHKPFQCLLASVPLGGLAVDESSQVVGVHHGL